MLLDAPAAKALAALIVISTQGKQVLTREVPLHVEDRGTEWLVKGTPHDEPTRQAAHVMFHVFIRKDTAEVTGLNFEARMKFAPKIMDQWQRRMSAVDYSRVFGPPTQFEPDGIPDLVPALYGGIVNTPADAVAYAQIVFATNPARAIPASELHAEEHDKVWQIIRVRHGQPDQPILSFSRTNGKVLSGDP
jgi:hypothetical protein